MSPENEKGNIQSSYSNSQLASSASLCQNDYATKKEAVLGNFAHRDYTVAILCYQYASLTIWFIINVRGRVNKNRYDLFEFAHIQI